MSRPYLYRGVSLDHHTRERGVLTPKGREAELALRFDDTWTYGDGMVFGASKTNGVIFHQKDSSRFPTAFVSFSPHLDRATFYATHRYQDGRAVGGYRGIVYAVDAALLSAHGVEAHPVADYALRPTCPEDDEVALLAADGGPLPLAIIVGYLLVP